jgi:hypothetical protein
MRIPRCAITPPSNYMGHCTHTLYTRSLPPSFLHQKENLQNLHPGGERRRNVAATSRSWKLPARRPCPCPRSLPLSSSRPPGDAARSPPQAPAAFADSAAVVAAAAMIEIHRPCHPPCPCHRHRPRTRAAAPPLPPLRCSRGAGCSVVEGGWMNERRRGCE